jgi:hypothetical protein
MNINILDETNAVTNKYLNMMCSRGFSTGINSPTRETATTSTCIDHIFIKLHNSHDTVPGIITTAITDHYSICLGWKCEFRSSTPNNNINKPALATKKLNKDKLIDADKAFEIFVDIFKNF